MSNNVRYSARSILPLRFPRDFSAKPHPVSDDARLLD
jgi:hypothetical protein